MARYSCLGGFRGRRSGCPPGWRIAGCRHGAGPRAAVSGASRWLVISCRVPGRECGLSAGKGEMVSEMVERVAEAMASADDYTSDYRLLALAAIAAMREPTEAMIIALAEEISGLDDGFTLEFRLQKLAEGWQEAFDAALKS